MVRANQAEWGAARASDTNLRVAVGVVGATAARATASSTAAAAAAIVRLSAAAGEPAARGTEAREARRRVVRAGRRELRARDADAARLLDLSRDRVVVVAAASGEPAGGLVAATEPDGVGAGWRRP